MKTSIQILPGIKRIAWIVRDALPPRVDIYASIGDKVPVLTDLHEITFFGDPSCETTVNIENVKETETTKLTFRTAKSLPNRNLAIVVTDNNGNSYLIGARERPFPVITYQRAISSPSTVAALECTVTYTSLKALVPCLVIS